MQLTIMPPDPDEFEERDSNAQIDPRDRNAIAVAVERYFQSYSPETVKAYKSDLKTWWEFCPKNIEQVTEQDILKYVKHLEEKRYQNATINRKLAALSKAYSVYLSMGMVIRNPVQSVAGTTRIYKPVDPQVRSLITMHDVEAVILKASKRTRTIVRFLANTGLRVSEMIDIKKSDLEAFDKDYMRIRVRGKGNKHRFIFIPYELYKEVKDIFDIESENLFASRSGQPLSRTNVYKQVQKAFQKFAYRSGVGPHSLRHFFATKKIIDEKKDYKAVSTYLGHSNPSITMSIYTHSELKPEETQII